jgi:teichuronic acid biosynthesis glycosyltransferase TuaG
MSLKFSQDSPLISIVMPCYNSEEFIQEAIESALNQTYKNIELIIVDDFSTDGSKSIITRFSAQDSRIISVYKEINEGAAICRNIALDLAQGDYIAFLDSDDVWISEKLETQIRYMLEHDCGFVYSYYNVITKEGLYCHTIKAAKTVTRNKLLFTCFIGCCSVVISRSMLGEKRQRDIVCRNDYMFWLDILREGQIGYCCPGVFSSYRRGSGVSSNKLRNFKYYCYVITNATSYGALMLFITIPIFLTINFVKKTFPDFYNKIIVKIK